MNALAVLLVFSTLVLPIAPALAAPATLRMGGFPVEPLIMGSSGEPMRGALPDFIMKEVAPHTSIHFVWTETTSYARALKSLQDGTTDVLLLYGTLGGTPAGTERFAWAYLHGTPSLAVDPGSPLRELRNKQDLAGLEIAWALGTPPPPELADVPIKWDWTSGQNWQAMNLRKLARGRISGALFVNPYSPAYVARKEGIEIRLLPLPMMNKRPFVMFYSLKADRTLIDEFERLAERAFKGDRFQKFVEAYMD
jgi:hypothetical protein